MSITNSVAPQLTPTLHLPLYIMNTKMKEKTFGFEQKKMCNQKGDGDTVMPVFKLAGMLFSMVNTWVG